MLRSRRKTSNCGMWLWDALWCRMEKHAGSTNVVRELHFSLPVWFGYFLFARGNFNPIPKTLSVSIQQYDVILQLSHPPWKKAALFLSEASFLCSFFLSLNHFLSTLCLCHKLCRRWDHLEADGFVPGTVERRQVLHDQLPAGSSRHPAGTLHRFVNIDETWLFVTHQNRQSYYVMITSVEMKIWRVHLQKKMYPFSFFFLCHVLLFV